MSETGGTEPSVGVVTASASLAAAGLDPDVPEDDDPVAGVADGVDVELSATAAAPGLAAPVGDAGAVSPLPEVAGGVGVFDLAAGATGGVPPAAPLEVIFRRRASTSRVSEWDCAPGELVVVVGAASEEEVTDATAPAWTGATLDPPEEGDFTGLGDAAAPEGVAPEGIARAASVAPEGIAGTTARSAERDDSTALLPSEGVTSACPDSGTWPAGEPTGACPVAGEIGDAFPAAETEDTEPDPSPEEEELAGSAGVEGAGAAEGTAAELAPVPESSELSCLWVVGFCCTESRTVEKSGPVPSEDAGDPEPAASAGAWVTVLAPSGDAGDPGAVLSPVGDPAGGAAGVPLRDAGDTIGSAASSPPSAPLTSLNLP